MANIIHDPTRGWLLLTEKWPEKEYLEDSPLWNAILDGEIAHCLSTAIEIDENDWDALLVITKAVINTGTSKLQDHHPYSVDAEFEVVTQQLRYDNWKPKEIARLVKAKETEGRVIQRQRTLNWSTQVTNVETESQDELWEEVYASYTSAEGTLYVEDLKKNFRIERI